MRRSLILLAPLLGSLVLAHGSAAAQEPAPAGQYYAPAPEPVRSGWNFGVGLGGGDISCEGGACDGVTEAASLSLQVGNMVRPRLRVVGDIWVMIHSEDNFTLTHSIVTGGVQFWVINRLWLRGGIGLAQARARYDGLLVDVEDQTESVLGVSGAIGFEVYSKRTLAIDIEARGGTGFYDDVRARNASLGAAITWY